MNNFKKLLCSVLAVVMVLTTIVVPTSAAAKPVLNKTKLTVTVGKSATLKVKNATKNEKITWSSNKEEIATVSSKGKITAKKAGSVVISAKLKKAGKTLKCRVTVKAVKKDPNDISDQFAGRNYKGTATAMGTTMDALELHFDKNGNVTGKGLSVETMGLVDFSGTYTAIKKDNTVALTITDSTTGTRVLEEIMNIDKDDLSELSYSVTVMGMDIPVSVVEVNE